MYDNTIAVLYYGSLAHYRITQSENGSYTAHLQKYSGQRQNQPPEQFDMRKIGRHWKDEGFDQELSNEIGKAIELSQRSEGPVNPERARRWSNGSESF